MTHSFDFRTSLLGLALVLSSPVHAWTTWNFNLPSSSSGAFSASETVNSCSINGNFNRQANGFIKKTISSSSGNFAPSVGAVKFAIEAPGFALFAQPFETVETQLISTVIGGACPTETWKGLFVVSLWDPNGLHNLTNDGQAVFGTTSWNPATSTMTVSKIYNITQSQPVTGFPVNGFDLSAPCSNGVLTFSGAGDRGGTMNISSAKGAYYRTNANHGFFIVPQVPIPSVALLAGQYSVFNYNYAATQTINPIRITVAGTSGTGNTLSNVETGATTAEAWTMSGITINSPVPGMLTASVTKTGGGTTKMACAVYLTKHTLMYCAAQSPNDATKAMNFAMVSSNQAFPSGSLDTYEFGNQTGQVTTDLGMSDLATSMTIQPDGKLVVAGYTLSATTMADFALVRYNTNGSLDTTFNGTGKVTTPIGESWEYAYGVAVQSDGKIVTAGYSNNGANSDYALVRYNANGSLDTTFNGTGKVTTPIGTGNEYARAMAIESNGNIVVAGRTHNGTSNKFALVRYDTNGSLDTTFNSTGKVTTAIIGASAGEGQAEALAIQTDGKIVAAGYSYNGKYNFSVVRYNANGSLDTTFNGTGMVTTAVRGNWDFANSLALQPDGKIVVAGYSSSGTNYDYALVRYNTNGSLDTTFNGTGMVTTTIGSANDMVQSIAIQLDGKILVVGRAYYDTNYDLVVARYNANGSLDTTFNGTGKVTVTVATNINERVSLAIESSGKIVAAGFKVIGSACDFALFRFWP